MFRTVSIKVWSISSILLLNLHLFPYGGITPFYSTSFYNQAYSHSTPAGFKISHLYDIKVVYGKDINSLSILQTPA